MCKIIKISEDSTAIICGGHKDHKCNEDAVVYGTNDGKRYFFTNKEEEKKWYDEHYKETIMGSVACSICGGAAIDNAWRLEE